MNVSQLDRLKPSSLERLKGVDSERLQEAVFRSAWWFPIRPERFGIATDAFLTRTDWFLIRMDVFPIRMDRFSTWTDHFVTRTDDFPIQIDPYVAEKNWNGEFGPFGDEAKNEPKKWKYKCICVRPILETTVSKDDVEYPARFQICEDTGLCAFERPGGKIVCTGNCPNADCKCTLFRLDLGGDPAKSKWILEAKGGKQVPHMAGQYYRCFCLK
jgi:hypothetical protein